MSIPFISLKVCLKQVKFDALEEIEKKNLQFFFPGYASTGFTKANPKPGSPLALAKEKGFEVIKDNAMPRRYAGDLTLPRSRYYTVCLGNSSNDNETLINELLAYTRADETGHFVTIDTTGQDENSIYFRKLLIAGANAIFCWPQETKAFPNDYRHIVGIENAQPGAPVLGIIPLQIEEQEIDIVIDLRLPSVQAWFTKELTTLEDSLTGKPVFGLAPPLTEFSKLLPTLLAQSLGDGRNVTQIAGRWLRTIGANALIFPSARCNSFTSFLNGQLADWGGWNLVDYRGAPEVWVAGSLDFTYEWDQFPMTGGNFMSEDHTEPIIYNGTKITSINKGNEAGSLRVEGLKEQRWYYYTLSTWFYFEKQIKNKYPFIDADMLTEAIFLVGSKDRNVTISTAAAIAGVFLGSIYNGPEQLSALDAIRNDFKLKDKKIYEAISGFLNLCTS